MRTNAWGHKNGRRKRRSMETAMSGMSKRFAKRPFPVILSSGPIYCEYVRQPDQPEWPMKATGPSSLASEGAEQAKSSDNEVTMKRRTYRNLKARVANQNGALHHHVYVVLLDEAAARS